MNRLLIGISSLILICGMAQAAPFTITSTLSGDPRPDNPDNLFINLTVTGDDTSSLTQWTVDIDSPLHPNAKLHEFYFNLFLGSDPVAFGDFNPSGWEINQNVNALGSGNMSFDFGALDPSGSPDAADVTNTQDLIFTATLGNGAFWTTNMFYNAATSTSSDALLGGGQLGAHLQALSVPTGSNMSDSGFLLGNYASPVPEPATMLLFGTGLAGLAGIARRKNKA